MSALPLQVLADFPHTTAELRADYLLDLFPEIQARSFSIASSLQASRSFLANISIRGVFGGGEYSHESLLLSDSPAPASDPGGCGPVQNKASQTATRPLLLLVSLPGPEERSYISVTTGICLYEQGTGVLT